eukprot:4805939-Karenia_brevis.AAC.1
MAMRMMCACVSSVFCSADGALQPQTGFVGSPWICGLGWHSSSRKSRGVTICARCSSASPSAMGPLASRRLSTD